MADKTPAESPPAGEAVASSDEELVQLFTAGDETAWALLLERYTKLLYRKALDYAGQAVDRQDEAAELYLLMVELLRRSLGSYQGRCKVKTWVMSVVGNRRHILKAFLLRKDPARADVRLPRVLQSRPRMDQDIYRRLVWGLEPEHIAVELGVGVSRCEEVEQTVASQSPRVYARIRANRLAQAAKISLDDADADGEGRPRLQVASSGLDPLEQLERGDLEALVQGGLAGAYTDMSRTERRVLQLMYNHGFTAAEVVQAAGEGDVGLTEVDGTNRCYYLKDRALGALADRVREALAAAGHTPSAGVGRRELLRQVESLLREIGVPEERS